MFYLLIMQWKYSSSFLGNNIDYFFLKNTVWILIHNIISLLSLKEKKKKEKVLNEILRISNQQLKSIFQTHKREGINVFCNSRRLQTDIDFFIDFLNIFLGVLCVHTKELAF